MGLSEVTGECRLLSFWRSLDLLCGPPSASIESESEALSPDHILFLKFGKESQGVRGQR